jgi:hypothetical protein
METNTSVRKKTKIAIKTLLLDPGIRRNLARLQHALPVGAEILIAGGAIRDIITDLIHGIAPPIHDIDLFVCNVNGNYPLGERLVGRNVQQTEFGGLRWHPPETKYSFDICLLPNFIIVAKFDLAPTVQNFLASIDLTVNAVIYNVANQILLERHCISAVKNRLIEFNTNLMLNKCMLAYRVLLIRAKTDFLLSEKVFSFIKAQLDLDTLNRLKVLVKAKQGNAIAKMILSDCERICGFCTYKDYLESSKFGLTDFTIVS